MVYELFDGLTGYGLEGLPEPSLATRWEISPDQRRFVFHLRNDGRWSNGRPITAHDFAFQLQRTLHPSTGSLNAEQLWKIKNGQLYTEGRVKLVLRDVPPFRAGDVVEIRTALDAKAAERSGVDVPDSNLRVAARALHLRDRGASTEAAYAVVPPGREVTLIELDQASSAEPWAYVHWPAGEGVYGWVPAGELTGQPNGDVAYRVRAVSEPHRWGVDVPLERVTDLLSATRAEGVVHGRDLLMLPEVLGIRAPDDATLVVETWGPVPYFLDLTAQHMFRATPRAQVARHPLRWTRPEHIVSSGPLQLVAWRARDRLELRRSPTSWRRERVAFERMTVYSMDDQAASTNYYIYGGCDATATNHIPSSYLRVLVGEDGRPRYKDYASGPSLGVYFYLFNTEKVPSVHLRRALGYAIDRRPIPGLIHGGQTPTAQFMAGVPIGELSEDDRSLCGVTRETPGVAMIVEQDALCYVPPPGLDFDPERARAELSLAREKEGADFPDKLTLSFNIGAESHKIIAEYVQHQWNKVLGLQVELSSQEWKTYLQATFDGAFEIGRFGNGGNFPDPESEFLSMFKCGAPNNLARWCDAAFQGRFERAETLPDRKQRLSLMRDAERVLVEDAIVLPLYIYRHYHLHKPYVRNLPINILDKQPLHRVWIDPAWRARRAR